MCAIPISPYFPRGNVFEITVLFPIVNIELSIDQVYTYVFI